MTHPPRRGGFITFEGGEGAGKSTQAARLLDRMAQRGVTALATREPGGSPGAERIREALLSGSVAPLGPVAEAFMFGAARLDHLNETIRPALERGWFVICDRFMDSTRVYQGSSGQVAPELLAGLERLVVGPDRPDMTIIFDLDPIIGLARAAARRGTGGEADRFERESSEFHRRSRQAFLDIARSEPRRCRVIDASAALDQVEAQVWAEVDARFPGLGGVEPRRVPEDAS